MNDRVAVNYVVRFADLVNALKEPLASTSLEWDGSLPHPKKGDNSDKKSKTRSYRHYYAHDLAQVVYRTYEKKIAESKYEFYCDTASTAEPRPIRSFFSITGRSCYCLWLRAGTR